MQFVHDFRDFFSAKQPAAHVFRDRDLNARVDPRVVERGAFVDVSVPDEIFPEPV